MHVVVTTLLCALAGLDGFWAIDTLLWLQHDRYPAAWEADGRPYSVMMRMPGVDWSLSTWLRGMLCACIWLFVTPHWAEGDAAARRRLRHLRWSTAIQILVLLPLWTAALHALRRHR